MTDNSGEGEGGGGGQIDMDGWMGRRVIGLLHSLVAESMDGWKGL